MVFQRFTYGPTKEEQEKTRRDMDEGWKRYKARIVKSNGCELVKVIPSDYMFTSSLNPKKPVELQKLGANWSFTPDMPTRSSKNYLADTLVSGKDKDLVRSKATLIAKKFKEEGYDSQIITKNTGYGTTEYTTAVYKSSTKSKKPVKSKAKK